MRWKAFKYALPLVVFVGAWISFTSTGFVVWLPVVYSFLLIPLLELFVPQSEGNLNDAEEEIARDDKLYDWFLYIIVPLQYASLALFLSTINEDGLSVWDRAGRTIVLGIQCAVFGINVAHELGHRVRATERLLSRMLLLTAMYMHFYIEHNRGHHKHVGTPHDPSSAPYGQSLYTFWLRSISGIYRNSWSIAAGEQHKKSRAWWQNEMLFYQVVQVLFCFCIGLAFGWLPLTFYLAAALIGILLLETVNYIEHYGLARKLLGNNRFERAQPSHSWNSNHIIGRLMLFELSRHSDHHYLASRKYQTLRHHSNSPQLPTGYPGSMILAFMPPLWFHIMHRRIRQYNHPEPQLLSDMGLHQSASDVLNN